jgi:hypothetical protein
MDRDIWYVSPGFNRTFSGVVTLDLDYRYAETTFEREDVQTDESQVATFALDNYARGQGLTWALRYSWRAIEYEVSLPWEYQQASAELGVWLNNKMRIFGTGGKESAFDDPVDRSLQESFWEAGFAYYFSDDMSAEFATGDRSFGTTYRGTLNYEFRRGTTSLSYLETPMALGFNSSRRREGIDPDSQDDFLDQPGEAEYYLSKRFDWRMDLEGRRTTFGLVVFDQKREGRFAANATPLEDQEQRGASGRFSWQAGARTEFTAGVYFVKRKSGSRQDEFRRGTIGANYSVGARTKFSLTYSHTDQRPIGVGTTREYVNDLVSLLVTFTLL